MSGTRFGSNRIGLMLAAVAVIMVGAAFAAVPFYNWFCRVTGYGGTPSIAIEALGEDKVIDRKVLVRFDANVEAGMPWKFKPMQSSMEVRIGESALAFYEAVNLTDQPIAGMATYNVTPDVAGGYFTKVHCFCFDSQVLQPGERVEMPVSFYIDPSIIDDVDGKEIESITLSYTFHMAELPKAQAAVAPTGQAAQTAASN